MNQRVATQDGPKNLKMRSRNQTNESQPQTGVAINCICTCCWKSGWNKWCYCHPGFHDTPYQIKSSYTTCQIFSWGNTLSNKGREICIIHLNCFLTTVNWIIHGTGQKLRRKITNAGIIFGYDEDCQSVHECMRGFLIIALRGLRNSSTCSKKLMCLHVPGSGPGEQQKYFQHWDFRRSTCARKGDMIWKISVCDVFWALTRPPKGPRGRNVPKNLTHACWLHFVRPKLPLYSRASSRGWRVCTGSTALPCLR